MTKYKNYHYYYHIDYEKVVNYTSMPLYQCDQKEFLYKNHEVKNDYPLAICKFNPHTNTVSCMCGEKQCNVSK